MKEEKAVIEMWSRRIEDSILNTGLAYFHHATEGLGSLEIYQNQEWGTKNKYFLIDGIEKLDHQLAENKFVVGEDFSMADITAYCSVDLARWRGFDIPSNCPHVLRWFNMIDQRPSIAA